MDSQAEGREKARRMGTSPLTLLVASNPGGGMMRGGSEPLDIVLVGHRPRPLVRDRPGPSHHATAELPPLRRHIGGVGGRCLGRGSLSPEYRRRVLLWFHPAVCDVGPIGSTSVAPRPPPTNTQSSGGQGTSGCRRGRGRPGSSAGAAGGRPAAAPRGGSGGPWCGPTPGTRRPAGAEGGWGGRVRGGSIG